MNKTDSVTKLEKKSKLLSKENDGADRQIYKPLVSLVVSAYNEAPIVEKNLATLCQYMGSLDDEYRWEMIFINDGSTDKTGELAEAFARTKNNIHVLHHMMNLGLGQALKLAFDQSRGDYIVTFDIDLSYSPDHIRTLLTRIRQTRAQIVVASPYMKGGKISHVPWLRRILSVWANRFLSSAAKGDLSTLTGMARVYDGRFLRGLNLRSTGMEVNTEIIYKAMMLRARIDEIPGHLDWGLHKSKGVKRRSSMKMLRHTMAVLLSGFLFRPVMFFILPGFTLLLFASYVNTWMFIHFFTQYRNFSEHIYFLDRASAAVAAAYNQFPHTFVVGLLGLMLAIQLISLGVLALQSKNYFEEIFHLGSAIYKYDQKDKT